MMKSILPAAILSLALVGAAFALPVPSSKPQAGATDLVHVGKKGGGKHHGGKHHGGNKHWNRGKHYGNKHWNRGKNYHRNWNRNRGWKGYHYRGRYWGKRYYYRPNNWVALGCINVGPVWYCP